MFTSTEQLIIRRARAMVASPSKWTRGAFARDENGMVVQPASPDATSFCAAGAIMRAAYELAGCAHDWDRSAYDILRRSTDQAGRPLHLVNDRRGRAATLRLIDTYLLRFSS